MKKNQRFYEDSNQPEIIRETTFFSISISISGIATKKAQKNLPIPNELASAPNNPSNFIFGAHKSGSVTTTESDSVAKKFILSLSTPDAFGVGMVAADAGFEVQQPLLSNIAVQQEHRQNIFERFSVAPCLVDFRLSLRVHNTPDVSQFELSWGWIGISNGNSSEDVMSI